MPPFPIDFERLEVSLRAWATLRLRLTILQPLLVNLLDSDYYCLLRCSHCLLDFQITLLGAFLFLLLLSWLILLLLLVF